MSGSLAAYAKLMERLWDDGESFLLVEHDIVLTEHALRQALYHPCEWSVSPYRGPWDGVGENPPLLEMSLGCTRFRSSLIRALPDAVRQANAVDDAGTVCPPGDWHRLDCRLYAVLRGSGEDIRSPHLHAEVPHHHEYAYGCSCGEDHG